MSEEVKRDSIGRKITKKRGPKPGGKAQTISEHKTRLERARIERVGMLTNIKQRQFLEALEQTMGIVGKAAKLSGIDRDCHYEWLAKDPQYKATFHSICELKVDLAEQALLKQVLEGNPSSTQFLLRHLGKQRGYSEKVEVEHSGSVGFSAAEIIKKAKEALNGTKDTVQEAPAQEGPKADQAGG